MSQLQHLQQLDILKVARRSPKGGDEVAATALNDSSQTHDETTDAVKDQQAPAKKLRLTEPGDPAEAVEKFGWRRWDQGGNGDCFFRSASVFLDGKLSTQPKATDSQQKASWIRAQTCQHIKKHSKDLENFLNANSSLMTGSRRLPAKPVGRMGGPSKLPQRSLAVQS